MNRIFTKIAFAPRHYRFVGLETAAYIMEHNLSLEAFTEEWQAYVAGYEAQGVTLRELVLYRARMRDGTISSYGEDGEPEVSIFY